MIEVNNKKEIEIIPTVMPDSFSDFEEKITKVFRYFKTIQIDVMDGKFVPSVSWPYNNLDISNWQKILKQEEGIPHWDKCDFEIDLMVLNQIEEANNWIDAGVTRIIGHYEAFLNNGIEDEESKNKINEFLNLKNSRGVEVYLAIAPNTENSVLDPYLDLLDGVQFMGIEKVGFQGQPFSEKVIEKISNLRKDKLDLPIAVDGGVNFDTIEILVQAGANKLSSGSLIFNSTDIKNLLEDIKSLM